MLGHISGIFHGLDINTYINSELLFDVATTQVLSVPFFFFGRCLLSCAFRSGVLFILALFLFFDCLFFITTQISSSIKNINELQGREGGKAASNQNKEWKNKPRNGPRNGEWGGKWRLCLSILVIILRVEDADTFSSLLLKALRQRT